MFKQWKEQTDLRKEYLWVWLVRVTGGAQLADAGSDSAEGEKREWKKHCSHLCNDAHTPSNDSSLRLSPAHPSKTRSNKHLSGQVFCLQVATACIEHCELHNTQYNDYQELFFLESLKFRDLLSLLQTVFETWGSLGPWNQLILRRKPATKWCSETICPDYVYFSHHETELDNQWFPTCCFQGIKTYSGWLQKTAKENS